MKEVEVQERRLADYRDVVGGTELEGIRALGERLRGFRVAHINSTSFGGGVSEILHSLVPLMRDAGLDVRWFVLDGTKEFFEVTKAMHNALQGGDVALTEEMRRLYRRTNEANAAAFADEYDAVVVHDPQPAALVRLVERRGRWIWRCHIDLTTPQADALSFLAPSVEAYDASIFSLRSYVPSGGRLRNVAVIPPSIDPLSPKNRPVSKEERDEVMERLGVDPNRPVLSQVGRFDPWKDPLGAIDVYRLVKEDVPDLQLLLVGSMATDDPEGWRYFERTARHAGEDPDVRLLTDRNGVGAVEVNVLQRESDVGMLKSVREGFGLTVSESLWKGVPVVGGNVGGIPLQISHGRNGYLVGSVEEAAGRVGALLRDDALRRKMGEAGREHVHRRFLITRHLRDYLELFVRLAKGG